MKKIINKMMNVKALVTISFLLTVAVLAQLTIFTLYMAFDGSRYDNVYFYILAIESIILFMPVFFIDFTVSSSNKNEFNKDKELDNGFLSFLLLLYIVAMSNSLLAMTYVIYDSLVIAAFYIFIIFSGIIFSISTVKKSKRK